MNIKLYISAIGLALCLNACGAHNHDDGHQSHEHSHQSHQHSHEGHEHSHEGHTHQAPAEESHGHGANGVDFGHELQAGCDFAIDAVTLRPMGQVIHTTGRIESAQGDTRVIVARNSGMVHFDIPDLTVGSHVKAGQALFTIDGGGMAQGNLKVELQQARAAYQAAKAEYDRLAALEADRLVTKSQVQNARRDYESARAAYDNLSSSFSGGNSTATAPIQGCITAVNVVNGQYIEAGTALASVAQNRHMLIVADVPSRYYPLLANVAGATLRHLGESQTYTLAQLDGSLSSYGRSTSSATPQIPVTFALKAAPDWVPGSFVDMYIAAGPQTPVLAVPRSALVEEMGHYFVYEQVHPEYFEKRAVTIGRTDGQYTEITSGLHPGDSVVARGAVLVKLAQGSGTLDAHSGHVH